GSTTGGAHGRRTPPMWRAVRRRRWPRVPARCPRSPPRRRRSSTSASPQIYGFTLRAVSGDFREDLGVGGPQRQRSARVTDAGTKRTSRTVAFVVGLVALAAVPALGLGAFAAADTDTGASVTTTTAPRHTWFQLSDTQKQCLADHGVTLPQPS